MFGQNFDTNICYGVKTSNPVNLKWEKPNSNIANSWLIQIKHYSWSPTGQVNFEVSKTKLIYFWNKHDKMVNSWSEELNCSLFTAVITLATASHAPSSVPTQIQILTQIHTNTHKFTQIHTTTHIYTLHKHKYIHNCRYVQNTLMHTNSYMKNI